MATINEILLDSAVSRQVDIAGYSNNVVRRIIKILNSVDQELSDKLLVALNKLSPDSFTVNRLDALLKSVRELNGQVYDKLSVALESDLQEITQQESDYQQAVFEKTIPVKINIASVDIDQVYAAAMARPFQGKLLKEWGADLAEGRFVRIRDAIRMGYVQNETISQMVQRIRGTRALNYADGLLDIDRRNAETVVRTAVSYTANFTREMFYDKNASLIKGIKLIETLDTRTCIQCMSLDGKVFPLRSGPRPPHHHGCRGTSTPVLKSWKELGLNADEVPAGTRASMDGQVPANLTYDSWLRKQTPERQAEILGKSKAVIFRDGGVKIDRFIDNKGRELTIEQLAKQSIRHIGEADDKLGLSAYELAKSGGKHAGWYSRVLEQSDSELNKSINSFNRQISLHEGWIKEPVSKISDYDNFDSRRKAALMAGWVQDIARQKDSIDIIRGVLNERKNVKG